MRHMFVHFAHTSLLVDSDSVFTIVLPHGSLERVPLVIFDLKVLAMMCALCPKNQLSLPLTETSSFKSPEEFKIYFTRRRLTHHLW